MPLEVVADIAEAVSFVEESFCEDNKYGKHRLRVFASFLGPILLDIINLNKWRG